ncbi:SprB repeat-containing protein [Hymenobacter sp. B81]|uniref:SprB repeat-containing protein n=1 Tax=Hymenobacter sp. B81 TaxID=3344878 RepID=UPI0037DDB92E
MAGERYARLLLNSITPRPGEWVDLWLAGAYRRFTASSAPAGPEEYLVQDTYLTDPFARDTNARSLLRAIEARLLALGASLSYSLAYSYEFAFDLATITLTATAYDPAFDFAPTLLSNDTGSGVNEGERLSTIRPVVVEPQVTVATCFGSATGLIELVVSNGTTGQYTYAWSGSAVTTRTRAALAAGVYPVTVTDASGASTTLAVEVGQNPRIDVLVTSSDNGATLTVTGGVAPYTYLWSDGATTAGRSGLAPGEYACTVTDAVGCSQLVSGVRINGYRYYFSRNPIPLVLDAGDAYRADPATKPGLTFVCEVWLELVYGSGEFVLIGAPLEQPADRDGRTVFLVQELLDAYLEQHVPAVGQASISRAEGLFRRFYLKHAEVFGTPPVRGAVTTLDPHVVTLGGLSTYEAVSRRFFDSYQPAVKPFFTWQLNDQLVARDQPEFLYFQVPLLPTPAFRQRLQVRYSDGTTTTTTVATQADVARYEVYCLPAGFAQLGLRDTAVRHVLGWEVWVEDENGVAQSERRRYVLDHRPVAQRRFVLYANSLGGMNTAALIGEAQLDAELTGEEAERAAVPFPDPLQGDTWVLDRVLRPMLKLTSGAQDNSRAWLAAQQDLLLSRRTFLLHQGRWVPGVLKPKTTPLRKEGEFIATLEFDFQLPRERHYTPALPAVPAGLPVPAVSRPDLLLP